MVAGGKEGDYDSPLSTVEVLSNENEKTYNERKTRLHNGIWASSLFLDGDNLLLCGGDRNRKRCLMLYNDYWNLHSTLSQERRYASAVTTADGTFIFGGYDSEETFEFLPKNSKVWEEGRTKIPDGFKSGCAVEVPEKQEILLIGGDDTYTRILKFDIETQGFEEMDVSLLKERDIHTCARLPDTNLIVISGGSDYYGNRHDTSEILNLQDNTITIGNPMNTKRIGHGMAVITIDNEDRLAVFGGYDGDKNWDDKYDVLDSVETLNPRTRKWEESELKLSKEKAIFGYISLPNDFISNL